MPFLLTKAELENFPCQMALAKISIVYARSRYNQNGIEDGLDMAFFSARNGPLSHINYTLHVIFMQGLNFSGTKEVRGPSEIGHHFSTSLFSTSKNGVFKQRGCERSAS